MTDDQHVMARFVASLSIEFVGTDLTVYGPCEEGEILRLPKRTADLLESWGFVEQFGER